MDFGKIAYQFFNALPFYYFSGDRIPDYRHLIEEIPNGNFDLRVKFLVLVNNVTVNFKDIVNEILERSFNAYIVNINLLIPNPSSPHDEVLMFTYYPYLPGKCSRCNIALYNAFKNDRFVERKNHFPDKLQTFYNCTIVVAAFNTTPFVTVTHDSNGKVQLLGFEGKLVTAITQLLNLSMKVVISEGKWGKAFNNRTYTGAFELVIIEK